MKKMKPLDRFLTIQEKQYPIALREIKSGKKTTHWIWYIFPQLSGLVEYPSSDTQLYAIQDKNEAIEYFHHPILGKRLLEITLELYNLNEMKIQHVVEEIDERKIKSCMTLFDFVSSDDVTIFGDVLERFFSNERDEITIELLKKEA
jgi:uncharacterized protein (DUF1810 family)